MESPEAYVRRLMVERRGLRPPRPTRRREWLRACGPTAEVPPEDGQVVDHLLLWPLVCALPERQRAVVVLRYHEGLSESGRRGARLLSGHGEVADPRRDAGAAARARRVQAREVVEGMSLDSELREVLVEQADRRDGRPRTSRPSGRGGLTLGAAAGGVSWPRRRRWRPCWSSEGVWGSPPACGTWRDLLSAGGRPACPRRRCRGASPTRTRAAAGHRGGGAPIRTLCRATTSRSPLAPRRHDRPHQARHHLPGRRRSADAAWAPVTGTCR